MKPFNLSQHLFRSMVNAKDVGAKGDGVTDDVGAINAALALGSSLYLPGPATYKCSSRILMPQAGTLLVIGAGVTLAVHGGNWNGVDQSNFPSCIYVTGNWCAVVGEGQSSVIQNAAGSDACGISFVHCYGGHVGMLRIRGNRDTVPAITDDTFQTGIDVIKTTEGFNAKGLAVRATVTTIEDVHIEEFTQYGMNVYGELSTVQWNNLLIENIGRAGDAQSVGAGVAITFGVRDLVGDNFTIRKCKGKAIFGSSAGRSSYGHSLANFSISECGDGIVYSEEASFGAVVGTGIEGLAIGPGVVRACTGMGIRLGTYDNAGFIRNVAINGVVSIYNSYGVLLQSNPSPNDVRAVTIAGCVFQGSVNQDLGIGPNVRDVRHDANQLATYGDNQMDFTPTVVGGTTPGAGVYGSQLGKWQMITDNIVWVSMVIDYSGHTGTGALQIAGLPKIALAGEPSAVMQAVANGLSSPGTIYASPIGGTNKLNILDQQLVAGSLNLGVTAMDAQATLRIQGTYRI